MPKLQRDRLIWIIFPAICLAGCSSGWTTTVTGARQGPADPVLGVSSSPRIESGGRAIAKGGGVYKLGNPYQIAGNWYTPAENPSYDRSGVASWYGSDFHGRKTSNGETYDMHALSAAHPTLPMPSYVYVTNLDNRRTIMVRVNDRGPYVKGRILDLSRTAADALGVVGNGTAPVRVRYAGPAPLSGDDGKERKFLASQPWYQAGPRLAATGTPVFAKPPSLPVAQRSDGEGWSPYTYRANDRSGLGR